MTDVSDALDLLDVQVQTVQVPCVSCGEPVDTPPESFRRSQPVARKHPGCPTPRRVGLNA